MSDPRSGTPWCWIILTDDQLEPLRGTAAGAVVAAINELKKVLSPCEDVLVRCYRHEARGGTAIEMRLTKQPVDSKLSS